MRQRLLRVALPYAESLKSRPGVRAIMLYGSLVRGSLTPFSDIDIALLYDSEPPYRIEHRLVDGTKVDVISFSVQEVTKLLDPIPSALNFGFPICYLLESLLLAGPDSILHDPTGELTLVKTRLTESTSYDRLAKATIRDDLSGCYREAIEAARVLLGQGNAREALKKAKLGADILADSICVYTVSKRTDEAAAQLGIHSFAAKYYELVRLASASEARVEAVWAATKALWEHSVQSAVEPLKNRLREQGVSDPDHLELVGDYDLFWPGGGVNELGRVLAEVDLSVRWCRSELDRGRGEAALGYLWACKGSAGIRHRWERLNGALIDSGYDCSTIVQKTLEGQEFRALGEQLDSLLTAVEDKPVGTPDVRRALELTQEMEQLLRQALPLL